MADLNGKHVFISYVREDADHVEQLCKVLAAAQIPYWHDRSALGPGDAWKAAIRQAIRGGSLVFLGCFSDNSRAKQKSYMNEELTLAVEEYRKMPPGRTWIIPVRFDAGEVPEWDLGAGRTLGDLNFSDLYGADYMANVARLVTTIHRLMKRHQEGTSSGQRVLVVEHDEEDRAFREARARLGAELRRIRRAAHKTSHEMGSYSTMHISMTERGLTSISADLLEEYVRIGGDRASLLMMLGDVRRASDEHESRMRLERGGRGVATPAPPDADPMEIRRTYQISLMDDFFRFDANRVPFEIDHIVRVRALTPGVNYFVMDYAYNVDKRRGILKLEPTSGCRIERVVETEVGSLGFVLSYDRGQAVEETDIYEFSYRMHIKSTVPSRPIAPGSTRSGVTRCIRRVQFDPSDLPTQVWWYRESENLATENPPRPGCILPPNRTGRYQREFTHLLREFYGLAWRWPPDK